MSGRTNRPLDVDTALTDWLRGSPRLSADHVVASALTEVAKTPQPRSLFFVDATVFRVGLIAAAVAALAIGLGLGLGPHLIGTDASPTPSIGPAPSDENPPLVSYTNPVLGYELLLPPAWVASAEPMSDNREGVPPGTAVPGVVRFGNSEVSLQPALMISVGTADGEVFICETGICAPQTVADLDELDAAVASVPASALGVPLLSTTEVLVDGEVGRIESPRSVTCDDGCWFSMRSGMTWLPGRPQVHRTVTFLHDGRPVVLAFDYFSASLEEVRAIVESFRFLDSDATTPTPSDIEAGFAHYTAEAGTYEVSVPSAWGLRTDLFGDGAFYGIGDPSLPVTGWGEGYERPYTALVTISVGDSQGRIRLCQASGCFRTYEVGNTIEEMDAAIASLTQPEGGFPSMTEYRWEVRLDSEPALFVGITSPHGWTATPQFRHVFAVHEGRPLVIAFEHWALMNATGDERQSWRRLIDTFRFLDGW